MRWPYQHTCHVCCVVGAVGVAVRMPYLVLYCSRVLSRPDTPVSCSPCGMVRICYALLCYAALCLTRPYPTVSPSRAGLPRHQYRADPSCYLTRQHIAYRIALASRPDPTHHISPRYSLVLCSPHTPYRHTLA